MITSNISKLFYFSIVATISNFALADLNTYVFWSNSVKDVQGYITINKGIGDTYKTLDNVVDWKVSINGQTLHKSNSRISGGSVTNTLAPNNPFESKSPKGISDLSIGFKGKINIIITRDSVAIVEKDCVGSIMLCYKDSGTLLISDLNWALRPKPLPVDNY